MISLPSLIGLGFAGLYVALHMKLAAKTREDRHTAQEEDAYLHRTIFQ